MTQQSVEHTAGKWRAWRTSSGEWAVDASGCVTVAHMNDLSDETEANARLIAAAPALLEALEALVGRCTDCGAPATGFAVAQDKNVCEKHKPSAGGFQAYGSPEEIAARATIAKARAAHGETVQS